MSGDVIHEVLAVRDLTVRYGRQVALDAVSLAVPRGAVYALLGRNGAGKSSLIRCLLGQQHPARGHLSLFGLDPWRNRPALIARVGVVPETPDAPPELSAEQLSALCGRLNRKWDRGGVAERLRRFDVPARTPFQRLSRGEKGAVMLALALGHSRGGPCRLGGGDGRAQGALGPAPRGDLHRGREREGGGVSLHGMKALVAIAGRELRRRWMILPAAR